MNFSKKISEKVGRYHEKWYLYIRNKNTNKMKKNTKRFHQLLRDLGVTKIQIFSFIYQYRYNGVQVEWNVFTEKGHIKDTSDLDEEFTELLRDEIVEGEVSYNDIRTLIPNPIELIDENKRSLRKDNGWFEVELGTDS